MVHAVRVNDLAPEQAAYLAGLIDGEGTIYREPEHGSYTRYLWQIDIFDNYGK